MFVHFCYSKLICYLFVAIKSAKTTPGVCGTGGVKLEPDQESLGFQTKIGNRRHVVLCMDGILVV